MKKFMSKSLILLIIALFAYLVVAEFADHAVSIVSPTADTNYTGNLLLNVTLNNTYESNATNVTFFFYNATDGNLAYNITFENSTSNQTLFNTTINTALVLSDGTYNLTVNATNASKVNIENSTIMGVTIDNTAPAVGAFTSPTDGTYYSNLTSTILLNVSITDATIGIDTVLFQISNDTNAFNLTASNVSSYWNATLNFTLLSMAEANHTITVLANDTLNNLNNSVTVNIVYDNTDPVINSLSAVTLSTTTGNLTVNSTDATAGVANCTYLTIPGSVSGTLSGSNPYNATISGLSADTAYTVNVTCTDNAGNTQTNTTASFTTTAAAAAAAAATTTTSSTGGGGSATSQVAGQFSKAIWDHLNAGETVTVSVNNGEIGVTEVRFEASKKRYGVWMKVEKKDSLPSSVKNFDLKTYRYIEITKSLAFKEGDMVNSEIDFKVKKSWLTDEMLSKDNIALFRYVDDSWTELKTTVEDDDSTYVYYLSETPGFSYFAIAQKEEVSAPVVGEPAEEVVGEVVGETTEEAGVEEVTEDGTKRPVWPWVVLSLVVIIGIVAGYFFKWRNVPVKSKKR